MKKKFVIETTIDPKKVLGPAVFDAMTRLCKLVITGDAKTVYPDEGDGPFPESDAWLIRKWLNGNVVERAQPLIDDLPNDDLLNGGNAKPIFDPEMDAVPFAPR